MNRIQYLFSIFILIWLTVATAALIRISREQSLMATRNLGMMKCIIEIASRFPVVAETTPRRSDIILPSPPKNTKPRTVVLEWDVVWDSDVCGYGVYGGTNSHDYQLLGEVKGRENTQYPVTLIPGRDYYFAVVSKTARKLTSDYSKEYKFSCK